MWKQNYWTCGVFNYLNIKFFVSLNAIFLFLDSLTCAFCAQVNMTHLIKHKIELECQRRVIKENAYTYSNIGNGLDAIKIDEYTFNTFINIWFFIRRFKF
jgi:hypothetical protein